MAALRPRTVALTDQVLAALSAEGGLPISTPALLGKLNPPLQSRGLFSQIEERKALMASGRLVFHSELLRVLNRLARLGEVEKMSLDGLRSLYWRRWPA